MTPRPRVRSALPFRFELVPRLRSWIAGAALLLATGPMTAQELPRDRERASNPAEIPASLLAGMPGPPSPAAALTGVPSRGQRTLPDTGDRPGPFRVFGASLVVPGSGQWMLGRRRSYVYLGLEVLGWAAYLERRSDAVRFRDRYRDLAWEVARRGSGSPRIEGSFAYYEAMARYPASGAWDAEPDRSGLQPESDPGTYNGSVWSLARQLYLSGGEADPSSPAYERALAYYREHGYPPEMAWDWRNDPGAAERYRDLLDRSDGRFRAATLTLGAIVANHLLSAVDAYVSVRVARNAGHRAAPPGAGRPVRADRWTVEIRLPTDR